MVKDLPTSAGDTRDVGWIPASGRYSGVGNGNPLQCSCLGNPMDREAWWTAVREVAKESDMIEWLTFSLSERLNVNCGCQTNNMKIVPL